MTIFFDVDGVLNKESDWHQKYSIDKSCIVCLAELRRSLLKWYDEVEFVLTSTWRAGIANRGEKISTKQIRNLEQKLKEAGIVISGSTPISGNGRQAEVEYYIHRNDVTDYIVIDDDESLFEDPKRIILYVTDYKKGLTSVDVKAILSMIKKLRRKRKHTA